MLKVTASPALHRLGLMSLLMLCVSLPAHAQWKWKDAAGKIQYSDLPPPNGTPEKDILQRPPGQKLQVFTIPPAGAASAASAPAPIAAPTKADVDAQARQKQQDQEQAAKQKDEERKAAATRRENCSRAQENMKLLQDGTRINRLNDKGERVILDDSQRAEEMRRTQGLINSECR